MTCRAKFTPSRLAEEDQIRVKNITSKATKDLVKAAIDIVRELMKEKQEKLKGQITSLYIATGELKNTVKSKIEKCMNHTFKACSSIHCQKLKNSIQREGLECSIQLQNSATLPLSTSTPLESASEPNGREVNSNPISNTKDKELKETHLNSKWGGETWRTKLVPSLSRLLSLHSTPPKINFATESHWWKFVDSTSY